MRKQIAGGKSILLAVIILAFFHRFSYHYGALSQKRTIILIVLFFFMPAYDLHGHKHPEDVIAANQKSRGPAVPRLCRAHFLVSSSATLPLFPTVRLQTPAAFRTSTISRIAK